MDDLYREIILDHFKNPRNFGKLKNPTTTFSLYNSACGDRIEIDIKIKSQKSKVKIIDDIKFTGVGCAISIASASLLTESVMGKDIKEVERLTTEDVLKMLGITLTPTRLKCALLPLEVLQKAVNSSKI